jgi:adenosylhomocysteinase
MQMDDAAAIGDVFCTATGMKDVLVGRHFDSMKEGAIICNTGHYDCEINIPDLEQRASRIYTIREDNEAFELASGRTIHLLARGRLVNLAAAEGHPSEVMDMSFANQFLALCRLAAEGEGYDNIVYDISAEQDSELAALKLAAEGVSIDSLTAEQLSYLNDYSAGT